MLNILIVHIWMSLVISAAHSSTESFRCKFCQQIVTEMDKILAANTTITEIEKVGAIACEAKKAGGNCEGPFNSWQCKQVCQLAVQTYESLVDDLLIRYADPSVLCFTIHNNIFDCPKPIEPNPTPVPNIISDQSSPMDYNASDKYGYILQIPDLHWDMQYKANSVANCGEPVCCRANDNNHNYSHSVMYGGIYGIANESAMCDTPYAVIESMVAYIESEIILNNSVGINAHNLDFIIFVGDVEAHDTYNQTQNSHLTAMQKWISLLQNGLSKKYEIPIFFDLGNHEGLPVNNFGGPSTDAWFNKPVGQWLAQLGIDTKYSQNDTHAPSEIMSYSAYYTALIRPGLRLIALNTGYISEDNFYLKVSEWDSPYIDIAGQYKWLNRTLFEAKYVLNETVFIILHHPIKSALTQFEHLYYELYVEYAQIILGLFAGHTHLDHFHILSDENHKPFATWFSPGSVTQMQGRNPAFRVFKYDRVSNELINYYQYRFETKKANKDHKPYWFLAYDALTEYNLKDISAISMAQMAHALSTNDTLWDRFEYNYYNGISHSTSLDRNSTICDLLSATNEQYNDCIQNVLESSLSAKDYQTLYWG